MLLGPHFVVGAAVASTLGFGNQLLGILLAFLSHFALDAIPHWEYSVAPLRYLKKRGLRYVGPIFRRIAADVAVGFLVIIIAVAISTDTIPVWAWLGGGFFGILPDGLTFLHWINEQRQQKSWERPSGTSKLYRRTLALLWHFHHRVHFDKQKGGPPLRVGLATQAVAVLLGFYFLVF